MLEGRRILLGVTGGIAAYKAAELARLLMTRGAEVQVAMTRAAQRFIAPMTFEALTQRVVITDLYDARSRGGLRRNPHGPDAGTIEHVEQAHAVDLVVVAPATANTIARIAGGFASDALTAIVLATRAPIVVAPAMETGMWENAATRDNVAKLISRGVRVVPPESGALASGRSGVGRLAALEAIAGEVERVLSARASWAGRRVLITAGPTVERIDPVRVLTNRSTGAMGIAIASAALSRGASVTLVLGPTHLAPPSGAHVVRVESAVEMLDACARAAGASDVLIATAAVSDFRPASARPSKLKRADASAHTLELTENPDVLATIASRHRASLKAIVGFAAETERAEENARDKLARKGCDLVIANLVGPDRGFGAVDTEVLSVRGGAAAVRFGPASKAAVADFVLDQVEEHLGERGRP